MTAQGWYRDPYGVHEDRYFSAGQPTKLVRDAGEESYDPPPPGPPPEELTEVPAAEPGGGDDLRRADELAAAPGYDPKAARRALLDEMTAFKPLR